MKTHIFRARRPYTTQAAMTRMRNMLDKWNKQFGSDAVLLDDSCITVTRIGAGIRRMISAQANYRGSLSGSSYAWVSAPIMDTKIGGTCRLKIREDISYKISDLSSTLIGSCVGITTPDASDALGASIMQFLGDYFKTVTTRSNDVLLTEEHYRAIDLGHANICITIYADRTRIHITVNLYDDKIGSIQLSSSDERGVRIMANVTGGQHVIELPRVAASEYYTVFMQRFLCGTVARCLIDHAIRGMFVSALHAAGIEYYCDSTKENRIRVENDRDIIEITQRYLWCAGCTYSSGWLDADVTFAHFFNLSTQLTICPLFYRKIWQILQRTVCLAQSETVRFLHDTHTLWRNSDGYDRTLEVRHWEGPR